MKRFLTTLISNALAIILMPYIFSTVHVSNLESALIAALILGLVNAFIKPVMSLLSLPITVLTFGLFAFVINGAMLKLTSMFVNGFQIDNWLTAILGAIVLSIISSIIQRIIR